MGIEIKEGLYRVQCDGCSVYYKAEANEQDELFDEAKEEGWWVGTYSWCDEYRG